MAIQLFYIPYPTEALASSEAKRLVELKLAACANIFPISSVYEWAGSMQQEGEYVVLLKTVPELSDELERAIMSSHPYEVPCIMRFTATANAAYEDWIRRNVQIG